MDCYINSDIVIYTPTLCTVIPAEAGTHSTFD
jgi:hypothetical protein